MSDFRIAVAALTAVSVLLASCGGGDEGDYIAPRGCTSGAGIGSTSGLSMSNATTEYRNLSSSASTAGTVQFDPGEIAFSNPNLSQDSQTGSLRAALWAVPGNYNGGVLSGAVIARYNVVFSDGGTTLFNGDSANLVMQTLNAVTPPRGSYCVVVTLEEYDPSSCPGNSDGYCIVDWSEFPRSVEFY